MPSKTRQVIIDKAQSLFNKDGYNAVSLYEISGAVGISRGNLVYHFKSKDALLQAISEQMWEKLETERKKTRLLPSFENLHNEVRLYEVFQKEYAFIFLDRLVSSHPVLSKKFKKMVEQTIKDNEAAIAFAIEKGNMNPEPFPGIYKNLSLSTWMIAFFWHAQNSVRNSKTIKGEVEKVIWSMLLPHFTKKGIQSFISFFGPSYLESLGESFDSRIENYIAF